jgi:uncharacterized protein YndB with AHSA1/START domain
MISYRIEETINRPVHEVFPYVANPTLYPQWMPMSDVEIATPGQVRVGSTARAMMKVGSRMAPFTFEVTEYTPDASLTFGTIDGPMNWEGTFEVESVRGSATRITSSGRVGLKGWQRLLEPFMGGEVRRGEAAELRKLKDLLERPR